VEVGESVYREKYYVRQPVRNVISLSRIISLFVFSILIIFILTAIITATGVQYKLTSFSIKDSVSTLSTESFLSILATENPYFSQVLPTDYKAPSMTKVAFQLATNVEPGDIRSLLGKELPGFALFDTEIIIAGEGTNYTNLPIESAPPMDVILREREIVSEELGTGEETDEPADPPKQTTNGKKVVYIYQSHSYESYLPLLKDAKVPDDAYTQKSEANMIAVGEMLKKELEKQGIGVQHDTSNVAKLLSDRGLDHGSAYQVSRDIVKEAMASNDDLQLIFDLHRDAARKKETTVTINKKSYARIMFVLGEANKNYEQNEKMATELHNLLDEKYPGLSRGVIPKNKLVGDGVYNQDLSPNSIVIEFGGVDNTMEELSRTAAALADVISDYYWKAEKVNAQN
jgi:stage II sporulation protein P